MERAWSPSKGGKVWTKDESEAYVNALVYNVRSLSNFLLSF